MKNKAVYNKIVTWFDNKKWHYMWDDNHNSFSWNVGLEKSTEPLHFVLHIEDDHYMVYGFAPDFRVSSDAQNDTLRVLNKINSTMIFGSFEMVDQSSEVRFKLYVDCLKQTPSSEIVERSILLPAHMLVRYKENISGVASGRKNYHETLASIENYQ